MKFAEDILVAAVVIAVCGLLLAGAATAVYGATKLLGLV